MHAELSISSLNIPTSFGSKDCPKKNDQSMLHHGWSGTTDLRVPSAVGTRTQVWGTFAEELEIG
ncbi:hypothetical protein AB0I94_20390 [Streptomyces sp. NPDC050147]|uniref:hypothetical protein n=1 Tax=Streptomyces sp. NPDC050147 TaxID=3155513 RepID=UPI003419AA13